MACHGLEARRVSAVSLGQLPYEQSQEASVGLDALATLLVAPLACIPTRAGLVAPQGIEDPGTASHEQDPGVQVIPHGVTTGRRTAKTIRPPRQRAHRPAHRPVRSPPVTGMLVRGTVVSSVGGVVSEGGGVVGVSGMGGLAQALVAGG